MTAATGRILLIEDDDAIADLLTTVFTREGYAVIVVPECTLGIIQLQREPFDLVIADAPEGLWDPALTFLDELRPHLGSARLVINTAHAAAKQINPADHGVAAVWLKPYDDLRVLQGKLRTLMATT